MVDSDPGDVRIRFSDANRNNLRKIWEGPSELLDSSALMTEQLIVPFSTETIHEDDLFIVEYKAAVTTSADYLLAGTTTVIRIPITKMSKSTGQETPTFLRDSDLRSADVALPAGVWTEFGVYTVSAQESLKLGHRIPDNSRMYMAFVEIV